MNFLFHRVKTKSKNLLRIFEQQCPSHNIYIITTKRHFTEHDVDGRLSLTIREDEVEGKKKGVFFVNMFFCNGGQVLCYYV